jgi:hypothetical protein
VGDAVPEELTNPVAKAFAGWQVNGILGAYSGTPRHRRHEQRPELPGLR